MEKITFFIFVCPIIPVLIIIIIACLISNANKYRKLSNNQAGQIAFLQEENRRLREKLYMDYDPQKLKQEWQEQKTDIPQRPTGTHGRFSG